MFVCVGVKLGKMCFCVRASVPATVTVCHCQPKALRMNQNKQSCHKIDLKVQSKSDPFPPQTA